MSYDIRFEGELTEEEKQLKRLLELASDRRAACRLWMDKVGTQGSPQQRLYRFVRELLDNDLIDEILIDSAELVSRFSGLGRDYNNKGMHLME